MAAWEMRTEKETYAQLSLKSRPAVAEGVLNKTRHQIAASESSSRRPRDWYGACDLGSMNRAYPHQSDHESGAGGTLAFMRKRLITPTPERVRPHGEVWLDLERAAAVEVSSEEEDYPIESALLSTETQGWRASRPGAQTVRLVFDEPQRLRRIALVFEENDRRRTQEFVLRWSADGGQSFREIVRQQWNFSPPETVRELQEYQVELSDVTVLELIITPDISGGMARASVKSLRVS
jgi:hypothetical protein